MYKNFPTTYGETKSHPISLKPATMQTFYQPKSIKLLISLETYNKQIPEIFLFFILYKINFVDKASLRFEQLHFDIFE